MALDDKTTSLVDRDLVTAPEPQSTDRETARTSESPTSGTRSVAPPPAPAPPTPLPWLWQCHICYAVYKLACTRRCLDCGHYFCTWKTESPSDLRPYRRRRRRWTTCPSQFNFIGWSAWGAFRRRTAAIRAGVAREKNLEYAIAFATADSARKILSRERGRARLEHDSFPLWEFIPEGVGPGLRVPVGFGERLTPPSKMRFINGKRRM